MAVTLPNHIRELAQRRSANLEVTLSWNRRSRNVWISILDLVSDRQQAAIVPPERALDAFDHPFSYLERVG